MTDSLIHFTCSDCGFLGTVTGSSAGLNVRCVNCETVVEVPIPGEEHAALKCQACGHAHELDHDSECISCGDAECLRRVCQRHDVDITEGPCLECVGSTSELISDVTLYEYHYELLLDVLCCVMAADGVASKVEQTRVLEVMSKVQSAWSQAAVTQLMRRYVDRVKKVGYQPVLKATLAGVRRFKKTGKGDLVLKIIGYIASADDDINEREQEVCDRILRAVI
jgi:uncharacterized tellurite resistance protein B-like protein/phage FluMu protein Com